MKFLGRQTLMASIGVGLLVGFFGFTEIANEMGLFRSPADGQQSYPGPDDIEVFSGGEYTWFLQVIRRAFGRSNVEMRKDEIFVDKSGCRDTRKVQEAVDAVKSGNKKRVTIHIAAGTYIEKVRVPSNKPYITFRGQGLDSTIITWDDNANATNSTFKTASVAIEADHFIAHNISFKFGGNFLPNYVTLQSMKQNTAPKPGPGIIGAQAIALQVVGDKIAFYGCGMYGYQDTLNDHQGRHFFKECHIEGSVDFIFGNARSLYERCTIKSKAEDWGAITAHSRISNLEVTGFSFVHCSIFGTGTIFLGRAWRSYSRVVFASTHMENVVDSRGWDDWGNSSADKTVFYGEYKNTGPGADMARRVTYTRALTSEEAAKYTQFKWINGSDWLHTSSP